MAIRNVTGVHASGSGPIVGDVTLAAGTNVSLTQVGVTITINTSVTPTFTSMTLSGMTQGSVIFAGSGGLLSQNNTNFFWDDSNTSLIVGDPGSESAGIDIDGSTYNSRLKVSDIGGGNRYTYRKCD